MLSLSPKRNITLVLQSDPPHHYYLHPLGGTKAKDNFLKFLKGLKLALNFVRFLVYPDSISVSILVKVEVVSTTLRPWSYSCIIIIDTIEHAGMK